MIDKDMLDAIRQLIEPMQDRINRMDQKLDQSIEQLDQKLAAQKTELISSVQILMENTIQTQINLVAEDVQIIRDRMPDSGDIADLQDQISTLKTVVKLHSEDIKSLKKAQ